MHDLLELYDQELRIDIEYPGMRRESFPHLVRFTRPVSGMNYVSYSRLDEGEIDAVIAAQIAFFAPLQQPFSWQVCAHDQPPNLKDRLLAHGFAPDDDPDTVMVLDLHAAPAALLAPVTADVRRVSSPDQLDDVVTVLTQAWGSDFAWFKPRVAGHMAIPGYLSLYVAYVDAQPACSGWTHFHPHNQFASLFGGTTVATYRQRGLYTAVLATRVQEAIARGRRYLTTGASPMSQPILARHGFQVLTEAFAFEWKGTPDHRAADPVSDR
jgi:hypothetical protein